MFCGLGVCGDRRLLLRCVWLSVCECDIGFFWERGLWDRRVFFRVSALLIPPCVTDGFELRCVCACVIFWERGLRNRRVFSVLWVRVCMCVCGIGLFWERGLRDRRVFFVLYCYFDTNMRDRWLLSAMCVCVFVVGLFWERGLRNRRVFFVLYCYFDKEMRDRCLHVRCRDWRIIGRLVGPTGVCERERIQRKRQSSWNEPCSSREKPVYIYIYIHIYIWACMYMYAYLHIYVYVWINIDIYTHE